MTSENNDGFDKLWSSILLSSHIHVSLLSQSCRISLCTNPKDPNAQCVASKGMHEERLWAEGVTTHLCKLVKLRKRNNYRWQTNRSSNSPTKKQCESQHCDRCSPFVPFVSPASSYLLHLWEFPGSVPRCSNCCPSHRNVGFALPSMAVPACTCQRLGLRHDKHTTFHHTAILFLSVAAAKYADLILQGLQRPNHPEAQHGLGNAMKHLAILGMVDWPARNVWQASKWKPWKKHEKAEGYGYVKSWHSLNISQPTNAHKTPFLQLPGAFAL